MKKNKSIKLVAITALSTLTLIGCSGNTKGATSSNTTPDVNNVVSKNILSIDAMTALPTTKGDFQTFAIIRNSSSTQTLSDLKIKITNDGVTSGGVKVANHLAKTNLTKSSKIPGSDTTCGNTLAVVSSGSVPASIAPGGQISVPITACGTGSAVLNVSGSYDAGQKTIATNELIKFQPSETASSVPTVTSTLDINSKSDNEVRHGIVFIENTSSKMQNVTISSSTSNVSLSQTTGVMSPGQVIAVGLTAKVATSTTSTKITVTSPSGASVSDVSMTPATDSPFLKIGQIAPFDSTTSQTANISITNTGNATANISGIVSSNSGLLEIVDPTTGTKCGPTLAADSSCSVGLKVVNVGSQGSVVISANYDNSKSVATSVNFYSTTGQGLLTSQASPANLTFEATKSATTTITLTNVGGESVTLAANPSRIDNSSIATSTVSNDNCSNKTLAAKNGSCTFDITVTTNSLVPTNSHVAYGFDYIGVASTTQKKLSIVIPFTTTEHKPVLVLSNVNIQTTADNTSSATANMKVENIGGTAGAKATDIAQPTLAGVLPNDDSLKVKVGTCATTELAHLASCDLSVVLGPTTQSLSTTANGLATVELNYAGEQTGYTNIATANIDWTLLSNTQKLVITNVMTSGNVQSTGQNAATLNGTGVSGGVVFTLENQGTEAVTIKGVSSKSLNPFYWNEADNCTNQTLAPSDSCTITYQSVIHSDASIYHLLSSSIVSNDASFDAPSVVFVGQNSSAQFIADLLLPGDVTKFNVTTNFATVTTTAIMINSGTQLEVTKTLSNATNYAPVTVEDTLPNMFVVGNIGYNSTSNCSASTATAGTVKQTCILSEATPTAIFIYNVDPMYLATELSTGSIFIHANSVVSSSGNQIVVNQNPSWSTTIH